MIFVGGDFSGRFLLVPARMTTSSTHVGPPPIPTVRYSPTHNQKIDLTWYTLRPNLPRIQSKPDQTRAKHHFFEKSSIDF